MKPTFDFAIIGATPFAATLAGTLASVHGASVCRFGAFSHPLRLNRSVDIAAAPVTRPEMWRLLRGCAPAILKTLDSIGPDQIVEHVDPIFLARAPDGAHMLAHMRNVAHGYGVISEPLPSRSGLAGGIQLRDVVRVLRRPFTAAASAWLDHLGVTQIPDTVVTMNFSRSGPALVHSEAMSINANKVILVDGEAVAQHANAQELSRRFALEPTSALLTEPTDAIGAAVIFDVERGVTVHQQPNGAIDCVCSGNVENARASLRDLLPDAAHTPIAGSVSFQRLRSLDNAPIFGALGANRPTSIAGFGTLSVFLVPAIARRLVGQSVGDEAAYFEALDNRKSGVIHALSDYHPTQAGGLR